MLPELIKIFEFEGSTLYACQCTEQEAQSIATSRALLMVNSIIYGNEDRYVGQWKNGLLKMWA